MTIPSLFGKVFTFDVCSNSFSYHGSVFQAIALKEFSALFSRGIPRCEIINLQILDLYEVLYKSNYYIIKTCWEDSLHAIKSSLQNCISLLLFAVVV